LQDTFDLKDEALLKASGALTGGIGGQSDTCGSMIGASMIIGAVCGKGRQDGDDEKGIKKLFESVKRAADFYNWFKEEHGTVNCRDIVTSYGNGVFYDFGIPEQSKLAREAGVFDKCVEHVQKNVTRAAEILWDELNVGK
jgi:C_GCAxxG_C_C family probable redox protein